MARPLLLALRNAARDRVFLAIVALFLAADAADLLTTAIVLAVHAGQEANPLYAALFARGPLAAAAMKLEVALAWLAWAVYLRQRWRMLALATTLMFAAVLAALSLLALGYLPLASHGVSYLG